MKTLTEALRVLYPEGIPPESYERLELELSVYDRLTAQPQTKPKEPRQPKPAPRAPFLATDKQLVAAFNGSAKTAAAVLEALISKDKPIAAKSGAKMAGIHRDTFTRFARALGATKVGKGVAARWTLPPDWSLPDEFVHPWAYKDAKEAAH